MFSSVQQSILHLMEMSLAMKDIGLYPTVQAYCDFPTCRENIFSYLNTNVPKCTTGLNPTVQAYCGQHGIVGGGKSVFVE